MPKLKKDIYDVIIWVCFAILIAYIILKLFGVINTPEWINLMPLITVVFLIGAFFQKVLSFMGKMDSRTNYLKKSLDSVHVKLGEHSSTLNDHGRMLNGHSTRLSDLSARASKLEKRKKA